MLAHLVRREMLEQRRQPAMLAVVGALYALVGGAGLLGVVALDRVAGTDAFELVESALPGSTAEGLAATVLSLQTFLAFTQYLGISAVACGHAVLHDRQCGTLSFLLMAPIRRTELLVGKVVGAAAWPTLGYLLVTVGVGLAEATLDVTASRRAWLPSSPGWWLAVGLGGPAWAACVGAVCGGVSTLARDVRTAQQGTWFVVFFASLWAGGLLTWSLDQGPAAELGVLLLALAGAATAFWGAGALLSRDLGR